MPNLDIMALTITVRCYKHEGSALLLKSMQGSLKSMVYVLASQSEFGRSLWSSRTSKLSRVAQLANKQVSVWNLADGSASSKRARDLMLFSMEACLTALRREQCNLAFFNLDTIDKPGGGWAQGTFVKTYLMRKQDHRRGQSVSPQEQQHRVNGHTDTVAVNGFPFGVPSQDPLQQSQIRRLTLRRTCPSPETCR